MVMMLGSRQQRGGVEVEVCGRRVYKSRAGPEDLTHDALQKGKFSQCGEMTEVKGQRNRDSWPLGE